MKKSAIAAVSLAFLVLTTSIASAQVCAFGILFAAIYANAHENRELTSKEAMTCGLLYGTDAPAPKPKKIVHRVKRRPHS